MGGGFTLLSRYSCDILVSNDGKQVFLELNDVQTSSLWDGAFDLPYQDKLHDACESLTSFGPGEFVLRKSCL